MVVVYVSITGRPPVVLDEAGASTTVAELRAMLDDTLVRFYQQGMDPEMAERLEDNTATLSDCGYFDPPNPAWRDSVDLSSFTMSTTTDEVFLLTGLLRVCSHCLHATEALMDAAKARMSQALPNVGGEGP